MELNKIKETLNSLNTNKERYEYFLSLAELELDLNERILILTYIYIYNPELFKLNILLILRKFGMDSFIKFAASAYLTELHIDKDFIESVLLARMCNQQVNLPLRDLSNKEDRKGLDLGERKLSQSIAFKLYSNGKRSYYNICKSYNNLINAKSPIDNRQVILQKNLINLDNPLIERIFKLDTVQLVFIEPMSVEF